jgi:hypothetical protein
MFWFDEETQISIFKVHMIKVQKVLGRLDHNN